MVTTRFSCVLTCFLCVSCGIATAEQTIEFVIGDWTVKEQGTWDPAESPMNRPFGVAFDSQDAMYIVELEGGRVFRRDPAGELAQIAGDGSKAYRGDGGPAWNAKFNGMHNCAVTKEDHLLIADSWNHCVRRIDLATGLIDTLAGSGEAGFSGDSNQAKTAEFNFIMCISLNPDGTTLHITDLKNSRIRDLDLKSGLVTTVAGNGKKGIPEDGSLADQSPLVDPRAAASDSDGNLYVLERGGHALRVVRPDGTIETVAGSGEKGFRDGPALQAQFGAPKHLCTADDGTVYIADDLNGAIRKYDPVKKTVSTIVGGGRGNSRIQLSHPHGVCLHGDYLYIIDSSNNRILRTKVKGS